MRMKQLGILFGGKSPEHNISVKSALYILKTLLKEGYNCVGYYLNENNHPVGSQAVSARIPVLIQEGLIESGEYEYILTPTVFPEPADDLFYLFKELKTNQDMLVFPVFHGSLGEDGTIQGVMKFHNIPFIGCQTAGSAIAIDKLYTKDLCNNAGIKSAEYFGFSIYEWEKMEDIIKERVKQKIGFPCFIKPAGSGSSLGVNRVDRKESLDNAIHKASIFGTRLLCEKAVIGKEYSLGVIGNTELEVSVPAEVSLSIDFFDYPAKYGPDAQDDFIPARISKSVVKELQHLSLKVYKLLGLNGMARIDFFIENNNILLNEVNTIPGFGGNSLFHRMWKESGVSFTELIDKLIFYAEDISKEEGGYEIR